MRRVLVTGGGSGIGRAIAQRFAKAGDDVTICGRRMGALEETAAGFDMTVVKADVTDEDSIANLFETSFDVVVANAGGGGAALLKDTSLADWNQAVAINLTGTFLVFRAALNSMPKGGRLIAIASTQALKGGARIAAYSAAKHGVLGLVRSAAQEVARRGITCNAICPGFVDTPLAEAAVQNVMGGRGVDRDAALKMVVSGNPMGRLIDVDEVAGTALFLASTDAASVNGHALSVSGGEI